jgi:hypothetical protein
LNADDDNAVIAELAHRTSEHLDTAILAGTDTPVRILRGDQSQRAFADAARNPPQRSFRRATEGRAGRRPRTPVEAPHAVAEQLAPCAPRRALPGSCSPQMNSPIGPRAAQGAIGRAGYIFAMAYSAELAERIRGIIGPRDGVTERKMFGGIAWMVNGHRAVGTLGEDMMVRLDPEDADAALSEPHVGLEFTGRPMRGFLTVRAAGITEDEDLGRWIDAGAGHAASLPPKQAAGTRRAGQPPTAADQAVLMTRVFEAPREDMFKAWTDPDEVAAWYGPAHMHAPRERIRIDLRVGGRWELTMVQRGGTAEFSIGYDSFEFV